MASYSAVAFSRYGGAVKGRLWGEGAASRRRSNSAGSGRNGTPGTCSGRKSTADEPAAAALLCRINLTRREPPDFRERPDAPPFHLPSYRSGSMTKGLLILSKVTDWRAGICRKGSSTRQGDAFPDAVEHRVKKE